MAYPTQRKLTVQCPEMTLKQLDDVITWARNVDNEAIVRYRASGALTVTCNDPAKVWDTLLQYGVFDPAVHDHAIAAA